MLHLLPRVKSSIMQKHARLIIPFPLQNINQRHNRILSRLRPILCRVVRSKIRLREARIVREDFDTGGSVFNPLTRRNHAQRSFARAILHLLDFVDG